MKFGEWGKFPKRRGRVRSSRHPGTVLSSQRIYLMYILNKTHYSMKNKDICDSVQIGFLICTARWPDSNDWKLWGRYRSGPR